MGIMIYNDKKAAGAAAATMMAAKMVEKPAAVLGLCASGGMLPVYEKLIAFTNAGVLDWSETVVFHTSEFMSKPGNGGLQRKALEKTLYRHVKMSDSRVIAPSFDARDIDHSCEIFEERLAEYGGLDLLVIHVGLNGHIALNEPYQKLSSFTHVETLAQTTLEEFSDIGMAIPARAVTMGMGAIMSAKQILLVAFGKQYSDIVGQMLSGEITTSVPASMLQLHPAVTYIFDEEAALGLS